ADRNCEQAKPSEAGPTARGKKPDKDDPEEQRPPLPDRRAGPGEADFIAGDFEQLLRFDVKRFEREPRVTAEELEERKLDEALHRRVFEALALKINLRLVLIRVLADIRQRATNRHHVPGHVVMGGTVLLDKFRMKLE